MFAMLTRNEAIDTAIVFIKYLGKMLGFLMEVHSDGGFGFCGMFNQEMDNLGISQLYSAPYVSQSNGLTERAFGISECTWLNWVP